MKANDDLQAAFAGESCEVSGNTVAGAAPDTCAICGVGKTNFVEIL